MASRRFDGRCPRLNRYMRTNMEDLSEDWRQAYEQGFGVGCDHMDVVLERYKSAVRFALGAIQNQIACDTLGWLNADIHLAARALRETLDDESREIHESAAEEFHNYGGTEDDLN